MANAANIVIGANSKMLAAPPGSPIPADVTSAWDAAWIDLGYTTPDGIQPQPSMDTNAIETAQTTYPVRYVVRSRGLQVGVTLREFNKNSVKLAFGGGTFTTSAGVHTYTPPAPEFIDERMLGWEWKDGAYTFRWVLKRGMVTQLSATQIQRADPLTLPLTFAVLGEDGVDPFLIRTNHPGWA